MNQKEDCDELFDNMMNAVHYLLNKNKDFYPIVSVMLSNGISETFSIIYCKRGSSFYRR